MTVPDALLQVEEWLAAVPDGVPVVYVSFGTIFVLSPAHVASLIRTLNTTDFHVLWALPEAQQSGLPVNLPKNMFVHKWIPTVRALSHPKACPSLSSICQHSPSLHPCVLLSPVLPEGSLRRTVHTDPIRSHQQRNETRCTAHSRQAVPRTIGRPQPMEAFLHKTQTSPLHRKHQPDYFSTVMDPPQGGWG